MIGDLAHLDRVGEIGGERTAALLLAHHSLFGDEHPVPRSKEHLVYPSAVRTAASSHSTRSYVRTRIPSGFTDVPVHHRIVIALRHELR